MKIQNKLLAILIIMIVIPCPAAQESQRRPLEQMGQLGFLVEIDGVISAYFDRVEGLETTTEVVEYRDGIWTKSPMKIPGTTKYSNIILKRVYTFTNELWEWRKKVVDGNVERRNGFIIITGEDRAEKVRFKFLDGWPVRWKLSTLNRNGRMFLIEELEIAIDRLELHTANTRRERSN